MDNPESSPDYRRLFEECRQMLKEANVTFITPKANSGKEPADAYFGLLFNPNFGKSAITLSVLRNRPQGAHNFIVSDLEKPLDELFLSPTEE